MFKKKSFKKPTGRRGLYCFSIISLCAALLCCASFAFTGLFGNNSQKVQTAQAAVTVSNATNWNTAMAGTGTIEITLGANWTADAGSASTNYVANFGTGTYFKNGALYIPAGKTVILNLNGKTLNRNQSIASENGCVIYNDGTLTIQGTGTITGGYSSTNGGGIFNAGTLNFKSGTLTANKSTGDGGGIRNTGTLNISGGTISKNKAESGGGGVNSTNTATLNITGGTITENEAKGYGGGVYTDSGSTAISNATITKNTSGFDGGGICISLSKTTPVTLSGITVTENISNSWGGGIRINDTNVTIKGNSKINNNKAASGGGIAIATSSSSNFSLTVENTAISNNVMYAVNDGDCGGAGIRARSATLNLNTGAVISGNHLSEEMSADRHGGGVYAESTKVRLNGATIDANWTTRFGGGLFVSGGDFNMTGNTTISNNWTDKAHDGWGGGLYITSSPLTITGGKFYRNGFENSTKTIATQHGGAIFLNNSNTVNSITKCTFESNVAQGFGAVLVGSPLTIGTAGNNTDVVFKDNWGSYGGALEVHNTTLTVNGGTFEGNASHRGAIYDNYASTLTINGGIFKNNGFPMSGAYAVTQSVGNGAAIYVENEPAQWAKLNITGGSFTGNKATSNGGVIFCGGALNISGSPTFTGNQAANGSVVYMVNGNGHGTATISGGTFGGSTANANTATGNGGAIATESNTKLTLSGGNISYNVSTSTSSNAAGVRAYGPLNISGAPVVANNKVNTTSANLYSDKVINISGAISSSLNIYTVNKGVLTSGYNSVGKQTSATLFKTDLSGYKVAYQSNEIVVVTSTTDATKVIVTPSAVASATYSGSRQTIITGYISSDMTIKSVKFTRFTTTAQSTLGTTVTTLSNTTNALGYSISGTTITATEAGKYEVVFGANGSKTSWVKADGTTVTGDQTITITIAKKVLQYSTPAISITYDGNRRFEEFANRAPSVTSGQFLNVLTGWNYTYYKNGISDSTKVTNASSDTTYAKYAAVYYCMYSPVYKGDSGYNYYVADRSGYMTISKRAASGLTVTVDGADNIVYDGNAKKPNFTIGYGGVTMYTYNGTTGAITPNNTTTHGTLTFTVAYSNNIRPGSAMITITVSSGTNFANNNEKVFTIKPMSVSGGSITGSPSLTKSKTYDGTTTATVGVGSLKVNISGITIKGIVANYDNANVGKGKTITVQLVLDGADADLWDARLTYTDGEITQKTLSSTYATVADVTAVTYNGSAHTPTPTVTDKARNVALVKDTDYTISYTANVNAGTATITFTGKGNYTGNTLTKTFTINAKSIGTNGTIADMSAITFDGQAHNLMPAVTNTAKNHNQTSTTLTKDTDYTLSYSNSNGGAGNTTNAGTVTVTVTGKGNYTGSFTKTFTIKQKDIAGATVTLSGNTGLVYNASVQAAGATVTIVLTGSTATTLGSGDFTITYTNSVSGATLPTTNAGTVTVTITGKGNYTGTATSKPTYVIAKRDIATSDATAGDLTYTGSALNPTYAVTNSHLGTTDKSLVKDTDYTVSFSNLTNSGITTGELVNAGTVTITFTGKGNFSGTTTKKFVINRAQITGVTWGDTSFVYNGEAKQPKIASVTSSATAGLPANHADMFDYKGVQTNAGDSYTATATLKESYAYNYEIAGVTDKKTVTTTFKIALATLSITAITVYTGTYDGKSRKILKAMPEVSGANLGDGDGKNKVHYWYRAQGDTEWKEFTTVEGLASVTNAGTYTYEFKVTADNHKESGISSESAKIEQKSIGSGQTFASGITADEIASRIFNGEDYEPTTVIHDANATITTADYSFTYSNNRNAGVKTAILTVTGQGNYTGSVQILYTIDRRDITGNNDIDVTGIVNTVYNNSTQSPSFTLRDNGISGTPAMQPTTDFTVAYTRDGASTSDFKNAGTITITITGAGNYTGTITKTYTIEQYDLSATNAVSIANIADVTYKGAEWEVEPTISVTFASGTIQLVAGTDFDYSYADNLNAGTATVTITGKGNYKLSASKTFTILQKEITAISGIFADGKVYDGTTGYDGAIKENGKTDVAGIYFDNAQISGNLDGANLVVKTATGEFTGTVSRSANALANAGTGKIVTVTVTELGGSASGNYKLPAGGVKVIVTQTPEGGSIDIVPRVVDIKWEYSEVVYDGKAHVPKATINNLVAGDTATLTTGMKDSSVNPVAPNVTYTAEIKQLNNANGNYILPSIVTHEYKIVTTNTSVKVVESGLTVKYTGKVQLPVMQEQTENGYVDITDNEGNLKYKYTFTDSAGNVLDSAPVNAGKYKLKIWIWSNYSWSDGDLNDTKEYEYEILKATVTGVIMNGDTVTYDKNAHSVTVDWTNSLLDGVALGTQPAGITVTYLYNGAGATGITNAGTHKVRAVFTVTDGNYNDIAPIEVELVINRFEYDLGASEYNVAFAGGNASYTGDKHTLSISGTLPEGVSVVYSYEKGGQNFGADGVIEVGVYTVTATFVFDNAGDADNYKLTMGGAETSKLTAQLSIGKQTASVGDIEFADATVTYDGSVHRLQVSGNAQGITGVTYEYRKDGVLVGTDGVKDAGEYKVTAKFTVDPNYDPSSAPDIVKTLTIKQAELTVTANNATITYGDNPNSVAYTATYAGLCGSDTESSLGTLTFRVDGENYSIYGNAGTYAEAIEVSGLAGSSAKNYKINYVPGTLTVRPRTITVAWYNDSTKNAQDLLYYYSAGTTHTPYADVTNAVNGDKIFVTVEGGTEDVGMGYPARVTGVSNSNYALPVSGLETTFDILPAPEKRGIIIWDNSPLYYNGQAQAPKAYYYEDENDNSPKELTVTTNVKAVNAGHYTASVTVDGSVVLTGDKSKGFDILPREIFIEVGDKTCPLGNIDLSDVSWSYASGSMNFVDGEVYDIIFNTVEITGKGTYPIIGKFESNNADNYKVNFVGGYTQKDSKHDGKAGTLTVTPKSYDVSKVTFTGTSVTYDGTAHKIGISGLPDGVEAQFNYTLNGWSLGVDTDGTFAGLKDAGTYTVIVTYTVDGKSAGLPDRSVTFEIKKASLTVKANNKTIIFGDMPSNDGIKYLIGGAEVEDSIADELTGALTLTVEYSQYGKVGTYRIVPAGLTAKNYEISYVPGTLTVSPRAVTVTWYSDSSATGTNFVYDYDGAVHTPYAVATGMLKGDPLTLTVTVDGGEKSEAGLNYTARVTGVSDGNYCVNDSEAVRQFSIIRKNYIIWNNAPLTYNGVAQAPTATYYDADGEPHDGELNVVVKDEHGVTVQAIDAGTYTAYITNADGLNLAGDDHVEFTIAKKEVTVQIGNASLVYGDVDGKLDALLEKLLNELVGKDGFISTDGTPVTLECKVDNTSKVGTYAITGKNSGNANYVITVIGGTLEITKANVDESKLNAFNSAGYTVAYDGKAHGVEFTNLPAGVTKVTFTYYDASGKVILDSEVIPAGTYKVEATFEVDGNHNAVTGKYQTTITITSAPLDANVSFTGATFDYDGAQHSVYVTGDMTGIVKVEYSYKLKDGDGTEISKTGVKDAGEYTVTVTVTVADNYNSISLDPVTLIINKAQLTVTANNGSTVYGTAPAGDGYGFTVKGLASGDDAKAVLGELTYGYETIAGAGEYEITISGSEEVTNYHVTYLPGTLTVTPYTLTGNDITWFDKENGNPLGESGKFVYTYSAGTVNKPYAGTDISGIEFDVTGGQIDSGYGYIAEITGISGANAGNYNLPAEGLKVKFDVIPQPLKGTIVWSADPIYYNGEAQHPDAYYYDEAGNEHKFTNVTVDGDAVHAGKYVASVSTDDINYTLTGETQRTFEILARPVFIEIGDMTVSYGETPNVSAVTRGYKDGSLTILAKDGYTLTFTCDSTGDIGEYAIVGHFTCANPADYNVTFSGSYATSGADNKRHGTLKVVKATYDRTQISFAGTETTYDGKNHKIVVNGLPDGVTATCEYVKDGFGYGNDGVKNAGKYTVTVSFKGDENHEPLAPMTTTLNIKKASLTVKANDSSIFYGDEALANGVSYSGFADGESENTPNAIKGGAVYAYGYIKGNAVGEYTITPSGLTSDNYEITFKAGTLKVLPREITVTWYDDETMGAQTFVYANDGEYHVPYPVAGGLVNGDAVTLGVTGEQRAQGYNYVATALLDNPNYKLPTDGSATQKFTITAKAGSIVWDNTPIYYNGYAQTPDAYYFDEYGEIHKIEDKVTISGGGEAISAGEYIAVVYFDGENRYCPFEILPLEITVVIDSPENAIPYGTAPVFDNTEWKYGEGSNKFITGNPVELSTLANGKSPVGTYAISGLCTNPNYKVTFVNGTLTICKAKVDGSKITLGNLSADYDGDVHSLTVSVPDEIASFTVTYAKNGVSYGTDGVREAGEYEVIVNFTLKDSENYEAVADMSAKFTVKVAQADISGVTFDDVLDAVYNGTAQSIPVTGSADGVVSVTYKYYKADGTTPVNEAKDAGSYVVEAVFKFNENYGGVTLTKQAKLTILQGQLTVSANSGSVVYGETSVNANKFGYSVTGLCAGDSEADILGNVTLECTAYSGTVHAGKHAGMITVTGNQTHKNYVITYLPADLTVTPREITVAGWQKGENDPSADLTYTYAEGTEYIPFAVAGNTVNNDKLWLKVEIAKEPVGDGYVATVKGVYLADKTTLAEDYTLPAHSLQTSFTIKRETPVENEIVWNYSALYYDGTAKKPTATYYDDATHKFVTIPDTQIKTYDAQGNEVEAIHAGFYTAKVIDTEGKFTNSSVPATFEVSARKVYIAVGDGSGKYGEDHSLSNVGWTYADTDVNTHFIAGDSFTITLTTDAVKSSPVGKYAIRMSYTGSDDYEVIATNGSWATADADNGKCGTYTVEKAVFDTSKVVINGLTAVYDGTKHTVSIDESGLPLGVSVAKITYSKGGWDYDGAVGVGKYTVTVTFDAGANYEASGTRTVTLEITKAPLTVTANPNEIVYGDAPSSAGVTYSGLVGADGADGVPATGVLTGTVSYEYSYVKGGNVGIYKITPKGLASDNYDITYVSGALTVTKRTVTVVWFNDERMNSQTFEYACDGKEHLPYAEAGNVLAGDSVTLEVSGAQSSAGVNYQATVVSVSNPNYALPTDGTATRSFDIVPEAYVIVWESKPFVYNGENQIPEAYYYTSNGEQVKLNVRVKPNFGSSDSSGSSVYAGNYIAIASLKGGNVTLSPDSEFEHPFTIEKRKVTVEIFNSGSKYGEDITFNGWKIAEGSDGFVSGAPIYLSTTATKSSKVGAYPITGVYSGSDNSYDVTFINGVYTIEKAIAYVPAITDKEYTGALLKADVSDTSVYRVYQNDGGIRAGSYKVILELRDYENYKWSVDGEDVRSANYTVMFNVTKAENSLTTQFAVKEIKAGGTINIVYPVARFGSATVEYYRDKACTQKIEITGNVWSEVNGTYYAKVTVAETDDYFGISGAEYVYEFTVEGQLSLNLYWGDLDHEYDGTVFTPKAYVMLNGREIELVVSGGQSNAGTYNATVTLTAKDGTDLSKYEFGASSATTVRFTVTPKEITVTIVDASTVYGSPVIDIDAFNQDRFVIGGSLVGTDNRASLQLSFSCDFGEYEFVPAGKYAIKGVCDNKNYKVIFEGSDGRFGTYTVEKATINVLKNESSWFDEEGVIENNQEYFITLGDTDADGNYKNISLKGGQSANIVYSTFIANYDPDLHDNMTEERIKTIMLSDGGSLKSPAIEQGGSWVVYYSISADSHTTKYGIWKVVIEDPDNYIIINFVKPFKVPYGDVDGRNILPDLIAQGCIELGGKVISNLTALQAYTEAYAYEDVSNSDGVVNGATSVGKYTVKFVFNADGQKLYGKYSFKYSNSNTPDSDTNLDKFEVEKRVINIGLGDVNFVYDGEKHVPVITLKGLVGGEEIQLTDFEIGKPKLLELSNGDILSVTVKYSGGNADLTSGSYTLDVVIDNPNYVIGENASIFVTIDRPETPGTIGGGVTLPTWAIALIAVGGALLLAIIIIVIVVAKKRKTQIVESDEDGFNDIYTDE